MHGGQSGIRKFLKGTGTKSHLFIRCISGFSRGHLKEQGGGASAPPTTPCMKPCISKWINSLKNGKELINYSNNSLIHELVNLGFNIYMIIYI